MTASLEVVAALRRMGERAEFVATGQTGIAIAGGGIAVDAVVADFIAGAAELMACDAAERADWVVVEGQGSLTHPGFSGVTLGLLHGTGPDLMVLCHDVRRMSVKGYDDGLPLRTLREYVRIYEDAAAWRRPPGYPPVRVVAVALNTASVSEERAKACPTRALARRRSPSSATSGARSRRCRRIRSISTEPLRVSRCASRTAVRPAARSTFSRTIAPRRLPASRSAISSAWPAASRRPRRSPSGSPSR